MKSSLFPVKEQLDRYKVESILSAKGLATMKGLATRDALNVATELKLISDDDAKFAGEMLDRGFKLSDSSENWISQIEAKLAELEHSLQQTPYHRYLNGGPRPSTSSDRNGWRAKDQHKRIQSFIAEFVDLNEGIKNRFELGIGDPAKLAKILKVAPDLAKMLLEMQQTKADSNQLVMAPSNADDIHLCLTWAGLGATATQHCDPRHLIEALGDYEAKRLLSARIAEHAAAEFYEALGHEVIDVSIGQIGNSDDQWKDFDLLVNGRPIDVKNSRRSFSSHDSYVEHCVPTFKLSRACGTEVAVTGVLSEYSPFENLAESTSSCRILGEVTESEIGRLKVWARRRFDHILSIDGIWKPKYQPGWIFEYPPEHYPSRKTAIDDIPCLIEKLKACGIANDRIPGWLLSLCPDRELALSLAGSGQKSKILTDLYFLDNEIGFSRPGLFIYVMGLFLEAIANDEQAGQLDGPLRALLFLHGSPLSRPLGLEDSQCYVANLIDMLVQVQNEVLRQNIQLTAFRLTHPSILLGQRDSGSWMTLIAYCGGWREVPIRARCGTTPLFFGQHEICPNCGHLVCDDCGFCSHDCDLVARRQHGVVTRQRLSNKDGYFNTLR